MATRTYHIRRRLRRSRSTSFRLDRSNRGRGTFCGAACTDIDAAWADRHRVKPFTFDGDECVPCTDCCTERDAEEAA